MNLQQNKPKIKTLILRVFAVKKTPKEKSPKFKAYLSRDQTLGPALSHAMSVDILQYWYLRGRQSTAYKTSPQLDARRMALALGQTCAIIMRIVQHHKPIHQEYLFFSYNIYLN